MPAPAQNLFRSIASGETFIFAQASTLRTIVLFLDTAGTSLKLNGVDLLSSGSASGAPVVPVDLNVHEGDRLKMSSNGSETASVFYSVP